MAATLSAGQNKLDTFGRKTCTDLRPKREVCSATWSARSSTPGGVRLPPAADRKFALGGVSRAAPNASVSGAQVTALRAAVTAIATPNTTTSERPHRSATAPAPTPAKAHQSTV